MKQKAWERRRGGSVHHLKRSSPVANQVMIDVLVMSNGDRTAWGGEKSEQSASRANDGNLEAAAVSRI